MSENTLTVAILGASSDRGKFGNKAVRAFQQAGYDVYPVNPKGGTIEGLTVYGSLAAVPAERLNRISVYLPPHIGLQVLNEIVAKGCEQLWLNPGADGPELVAAAREKGVETHTLCSIVALGYSPADFPG